MSAPERRQERRGSFHGRAGVSEKRAPPSLVLVCCIAATALLAGASRTLAPKEELCLGSFWCIRLKPVACKPQGVKHELHTLPVDAKAITDGDTITVYVNVADYPESSKVPQEVREAGTERTKALAANNYQRAGALLKIILDAGYRQVLNMAGEQTLAKKYRIRLRGIDAPESLMPYGKEAKEELVRLVQGKRLRISTYDTDWYGRLVGDVDCDGVFVQEHMLKKGLAWHYILLMIIGRSSASGRIRQRRAEQACGHHRNLRNHGNGGRKSAPGQYEAVLDFYFMLPPGIVG